MVSLTLSVKFSTGISTIGAASIRGEVDIVSSCATVGAPEEVASSAGGVIKSAKFPKIASLLGVDGIGVGSINVVSVIETVASGVDVVVSGV